MKRMYVKGTDLGFAEDMGMFKGQHDERLRAYEFVNAEISKHIESLEKEDVLDILQRLRWNILDLGMIFIAKDSVKDSE